MQRAWLLNAPGGGGWRCLLGLRRSSCEDLEGRVCEPWGVNGPSLGWKGGAAPGIGASAKSINTGWINHFTKVAKKKKKGGTEGEKLLFQ